MCHQRISQDGRVPCMNSASFQTSVSGTYRPLSGPLGQFVVVPMHQVLSNDQPASQGQQDAIGEERQQSIAPSSSRSRYRLSRTFAVAALDVELVLVGCGRKGTAICCVHVAPLASRPVNTITTDDGTAMFPAFKLAESVPCAGNVVLPKKFAIEPA